MQGDCAPPKSLNPPPPGSCRVHPRQAAQMGVRCGQPVDGEEEEGGPRVRHPGHHDEGGPHDRYREVRDRGGGEDHGQVWGAAPAA